MVAVSSFLGAALGFGFSKVVTPTYRAQAQVLVLAASQTSGNANNQLSLTPAQVTATYASLMLQAPLLQKVISDARLPMSLEELRREITATPETDTLVIDVAATDPDAQRATAIANGLTTSFVAKVSDDNRARIDQAGAQLKAQIDQLQQNIANEQQALATPGGDTTALRSTIESNQALLGQLQSNYSGFRLSQSQTQNQVTVVSPATVPSAPSFPDTKLAIGLGVILGLVVGLLAAGALEYFDQGLRSDEDAREKLDIPVLAMVPSFKRPRRWYRRDTEELRTSMAVEGYRRLRTALLLAGVKDGIHSVVVTSSRPGEGKTRTAANLAAVLAGAGQRVLLVDADLRRPRQHILFGAQLQDGLSQMLLTRALSGPPETPSVNGAHRTHLENLSLVTAGTPMPNPSELLATPMAQSLIESFQRDHDIVIYDTPPCDVSDALSVAVHASATIVVVEARRTPADCVRRAIDDLRSVGATVIGVVLNKAPTRDLGSTYYYYSAATVKAGDATMIEGAVVGPGPADATRNGGGAEPGGGATVHPGEAPASGGGRPPTFTLGHGPAAAADAGAAHEPDASTAAKLKDAPAAPQEVAAAKPRRAAPAGPGASAPPAPGRAATRAAPTDVAAPPAAASPSPADRTVDPGGDASGPGGAAVQPGGSHAAGAPRGPASGEPSRRPTAELPRPADGSEPGATARSRRGRGGSVSARSAVRSVIAELLDATGGRSERTQRAESDPANPAPPSSRSPRDRSG